MPASSVPETSTGRADARRNRTQILDAAQHAYAEFGTAVSLGEIARLAGVGAGTVYRHFPRKDDLTAAVLWHRIETLSRLEEEYGGASEPGAAFLRYFETVVMAGARNHDLAETLGAQQNHESVLGEAVRRLAATLRSLLAAAQAAGAVRADVTAAEVLTLLAGCVTMQRAHTGGDDLGRPCEMVLDMLRSNDVTKSVLEQERSDESGVSIRHTGPLCDLCGQHVPVGRLGRPARYCRPACRQKAYRQRRDTER